MTFRHLGLHRPAREGTGVLEQGFPTRLVTRTKESNVHASHAAFKLYGEANAKSTKGFLGAPALLS